MTIPSDPPQTPDEEARRAATQVATVLEDVMKAYGAGDSEALVQLLSLALMLTIAASVPPEHRLLDINAFHHIESSNGSVH